MDFFTNNILIIMFLPLWVSLIIIVNSLTNFSETKRITTALTLFSTGIGLVFSLAIMYFFINGDSLAIEKNVLWLSTGDLNLYAGVLIDKISALFLIVLMGVSFVVQLYSHGYMAKDEHYSRYYVYLNIFNFSMAGLILSSNLMQTYLFWELVGISSYLLIGFWFKKYSASKAAIKAFIVNRIGDCAFLIGIITLIYLCLNFTDISGSNLLAFTHMHDVAERVFALTTNHAFYAISILLFLGAVAKSAQFPLHVWLADAMEAPTPISALIHAATMVAAGIYLTVRLYPLFTMSPEVMNTILYIGLFTAFITAFFALAQTDIKRMLAFSTSSQLGLMFVSLGVLAPSAALFHLTTHAFFKALLFLSSGVVIVYMHHTQNMKSMGGLRKKIPFCACCYLIGAFALSGLCFSGFDSKESLLVAISQKDNIFLLVSFLIISFMSSFYIFKSYFMVFEGKENPHIEVEKVPVTMKFSIFLLAIPSLLLGVFVAKDFLPFMDTFGFFVDIPHNSNLPFISVSVGLFAIVIAFLLFKIDRVDNFMPKPLIRLSFNKGYIDEAYRWFVKKIFLRACKVQAFFDKYIVDGIVKLTGLLVRLMAWIVSKLQNGNVQTYLSYSVFFIGTMLLTIVGLYFWLLKG